VIDLSADFRLDAETYAAWYGGHPCPELTPGVYGLTELHRDEVADAALVANPGCYPTARCSGWRRSSRSGSSTSSSTPSRA
jgi:N-acetyl-gamma-glutamyl-phosphate reductase